MNLFNAALRAVKKRPFILFMITILMTAAAVSNEFIPITAMIIGIFNATGGDFFDGILSVLQMLTDPGNTRTILMSLALLTLIVSFAAGLLLPGYLLIVNDGLSKGEKKKGLMTAGVRDYFFRFFVMSVAASVFTVIFAGFLMVGALPAIIVTRSAFTARPDLKIAALFIDIVTAGVFVMCVSFFRSYICVWYIVALTDAKRPFKTGKAVADREFWNLAAGLSGFDIAFVITVYLIYSSGNSVIYYIAGWTVMALLLTLLAVYLVRTCSEGSHKKGTKKGTVLKN